MPPRHRESSPHRTESTSAPPVVALCPPRGMLARQLSYAFEQSALQIKMKDFATYRTLMHQAIEFDEVRTRLQTQLMIQAPRSHAGPLNQMPGHSNQPTTLMRDGIVTVAAGACLFSRRQPAI